MRVTFDATGIVDVDRQREPTITLLETLTQQDAHLFLSTVTVAEILMGANLRADTKEATLAARRVLGQFNWIDLDGGVAEAVGGLLAYVHVTGEPIEFQDVAIAASHLAIDGDRLVTSNADHFERIPEIEADVCTPAALLEEIT